MSNNSSHSGISVIPPIKCSNVVKVNHAAPKVKEIPPVESPVGSADDDASEDSFDVVEVGLDPLSVAEEDEHQAQTVTEKKVLPPESPAVKPPLDRQYQNILLLLAQYNRAISMNTHCNVLFVITCKWISTFIECRSQSKNLFDIPPIDNSELLSDDSLKLFRAEKELRTYDPIKCNYLLKCDLTINKDYHLIPIEVWDAFVGWYGCIGPPLPRMLFRHNPNGGTTSFNTEGINITEYAKLNIHVECNLSKEDGVFKNTVYCLNDAEYEKFLYPNLAVCCQEVLDFNHQMSVHRGGRKLGGLGSSMSHDDLAGGMIGRSQLGTPESSCADLQQYQNPSIRRNFSSLGVSGDGISPLSSRHTSTARLSPLHNFERSSASFTPLSTIHSDTSTPVPVTPGSALAVSSNPHQYCFVCHRAGVNQRCSKCSCIIYCGKDCQMAHWPFHKQTCKNLKAIPKKQHIVNYNYLPAYAIPEEEDEKAAPNVVFNNNKNNLYQLPLSSWKTTPLTKSEIAQYNGAQRMTYSLYGRGGKVGLANLGNSCYMNSSIQCLSHIMPLTHYMLSQHYVPEVNYNNRDGTKGELIDAYYRLLSELWFESKSSVIPKHFKQVLGKINPEYAGLAQQDAHEVIELLLDKLHEDLNRIQGPKPYTTKVDGDGTDDAEKSAETMRLHKLRDDSIVHDTVGSLMRSQLTCPDCGKVSVSFEFHNTVQLAIPRTNNRTFKVVFVPDYKLLKNNTELAKPISFSITLDRILTVKALKEAVSKAIPADLHPPNTMLCLFESNVPNTNHLTRNLKDHYLLTTLTEGSIIYAYLPSLEYDKHVLVYQRIITPKLSAGFSRGGSILDTANFSFQYVGPPILVSVQKTWHTARVRRDIYKNTLCLFKNWNESIGISVPAEMAKAKELSVRIIDNFGHGIVQRNRSAPEDLEAVTEAQFKYVSSILNTNLAGSSEASATSTSVPAAPVTGSPKAAAAGKFVVHNSKIVLTGAQKEVWTKAVLKKGPGTNTLENEVGIELPFDKTLTLDQLLGHESEIVFAALDLVGNQFTNYDLNFFGALTKSIVDVSKKKDNIHGNEASFTLYDCLQEHTKEEILDEGNEWYCNVCKEHKKAKKIVSFERNYLPSVLILTLKRFEFRNIGGYGGGMMNTHREKITNFIDFPLDELDLAPYCGAEGGAPPTTTTVGGTVYDLFAVCNHYGRMGFGHYTAVAREWNSTSEHHDKSTTSKVYSGNSLSDVWYSYDDNTVTECTELQEIQNGSAYILFYRRRAV